MLHMAKRKKKESTHSKWWRREKREGKKDGKVPRNNLRLTLWEIYGLLMHFGHRSSARIININDEKFLLND